MDPLKIRIGILLLLFWLTASLTAQAQDSPAASVPPDNSMPSIFNVVGQQYPRIDSQLRAILRLTAPQAQKVQVLFNTLLEVVKRRVKIVRNVAVFPV